MIIVDNISPCIHQSPEVKDLKKETTKTKTKVVFDSCNKKVEEPESSEKGLAGRVKDAIVRNKRVILIVTGIALMILGFALTPVTLGGSMLLSGLGGGLFGWNATKLYLEKNGIPSIIKKAFNSIDNKAQEAESSEKGLAGRVKDAIVRNKRVILIVTGIALMILGLALTPVTLGGSMLLSGLGGGLVGWNATRLYQEKNGIPSLLD